MENEFEVVFFSNLNGKEPVKEWLSGLSKDEKYEISKDIAKVQIVYPFKCRW